MGGHPTPSPFAWHLWLRLAAVAGGYAAAFVLIRRAVPFDLDSPWFVIVAMICSLGLAAVARPVVPIRVPPAWRRVRRWETHGRAYRWLGVRAFGRLLRRTPLRWLNLDVYAGQGPLDPGRLQYQLEAAEASHTHAGLLVVPYMALLAARGEWGTLCVVSAVQVLGNVYPVMHLRLSRYRLERWLRRAHD